MAPAPLSAGLHSLPLLPTIKLGPSGADSQVGGWACACFQPLWVSPMNSSVRLGVSPAAASTPTGVFIQRFEPLFPRAGALGCTPSRWVRQLLPCNESSPPFLSVSAPPTGMDECFFFISLVVGLLCGSFSCQFWLFLFLNCCCPSFVCMRRHSVSTYASILARSLNLI